MTYTLRMITQDAWKDSTTADMWWESLPWYERRAIADAHGGRGALAADWWYGLTSYQAVRIWRAQTQGADK